MLPVPVTAVAAAVLCGPKLATMASRQAQSERTASRAGGQPAMRAIIAPHLVVMLSGRTHVMFVLVATVLAGVA